MPRTFFTADQHIGHAGILSPRMSSRRPFATIREHDETMVECWNSVVRTDDVVWFLGDWAHKCSPSYALQIFRRLNGIKYPIRGNHERIGEKMPWDAPMRDVAQIHVQDPGMQKAVGIWLSHYAHRTWPKSRRGHIHLYGHSHGTLPGTSRSLDVGVDAWNWTPVTLEQILQRMAETEAAAEDGPEQDASTE